MRSRERVFTALAHKEPDRVPRFEVWITALLDELGQGDMQSAYVNSGQDCVMLPYHYPRGSAAWRDGVDEWGRVWKGGMYVAGMVDRLEDLRRYSPPPEYAQQFFNPVATAAAQVRYPDHCCIFAYHHGPFTAGYMAMGFERFFYRLCDDPKFVQRLLDIRTEWCIALLREAVSLGAEVLVVGDDAAFGSGPMISPRMWRRFVLPCHRRLVDALDVPVIWHSDGDIRPLLPMAIEAGFVGVHGLEPTAGIDLAEIKSEFGQDLVLVGNVDVGALCRSDLEAVRAEVRRCVAQGAPGGGYMLASSNSIFSGMIPEAVAEMYRYAGEIGAYAHS
jgi:uroporphyrinogen decarboxylase